MAIKFLNTVAVDTDVLYVDTTNDRVGIGTTSPSQKLEVSGNIQATGTRSISSLFDANHYMRLESNGSGGILKGTDGGVVTTLVRTYGDSYFNGGNVGIGTTSPGTKLDVSGQIRSNDSFLLQSGTTAIGSIINHNGALDIRGDSTRDVSLGSVTSPQALFIEGTNGNVGVGTTSPGSKLDIVASSLAGAFRVSNTTANATTKYGTFMGRHYTNSEENITGMLLTSNSSATGGTVSIGGGISSANAVNNIILYTAANNTTLGGTERMRINSSGNVGIGTTSPDDKLHIYGSNDSASSIKIQRTDIARQLRVGARYIGSFSDNSFGIYTNSTEKLSILSNGNVGIGTTSPEAKLEISSVQPRIRLRDTTTGVSSGYTTGAIDFYTSDSSSEGSAVNAKIESYADSIYGRLGLRFFTGGGGNPTQAMTINWVGNVGIGTTNPTSGIHVNTSQQAARFVSSQATGLEVQGGGNSQPIASFKDTAASEKVRISSTGNVGIGTTSPGEKLEVVGNIRLRQSLSNTETVYISTNARGGGTNDAYHFLRQRRYRND